MQRFVTLLFHDLFERVPGESGFPGAAADRYKLSLAEFDAQVRGVRCERSDRPVRFDGVTTPRAETAATPFALTVDDGGVSYYTLMADRLETVGWHGHCLVTTSVVGTPGFMDKRQLRELDGRGHVVGSHSVTHPARFSDLAWDRLQEEWRRSRETLEDILGKPVLVASVPGGYYSREVALAAATAGLTVLFSSEPQRAVQDVEGCQVVGRHTLRHDSPPDMAARLVREDRSLLLREWLSWNAKKLLKGTLGPGYARLTGVVSRGRAAIRR